MIQINEVSKKYGDITAVNQVTMTVQEGTVFGLLGTNGAGKSTLIRMLAGVLKADQGEITIDGKPVFDNPEAKQECFYISDNQYHFPNSTAKNLMEYYSCIYPDFDVEKFKKYMEHFNLPQERKIATFSKGMTKQLDIIIGICVNTRYLFCDETFDGLDPVVRQGVKSIFANEMEERKLTPIIASHNLRELEDICDHIGLLHQGGILLSEELSDLKCNLHRVQFVLKNYNNAKIQELFNIKQYENRGKLVTITVEGKEEDIAQKMQELDPVYYEVMPLSLEEIFISETEVVGYDVKNLIF